MNRNLLILLSSLVGLFLVSLLIGSRDKSLSNVKRSKTIRIGYAVEAPYAFNRPDGSVTGEAPEVASEIAGMLGISNIVWIQTSFDSLLAGLESGRFDIAASGLFITAERSNRVLVSRPTFIARSGLLVQRDNPHDIRGVEDVIGNSKIVIAVLDGAVEGNRLLDLGVASIQIMVVPDAATGRAAVQSQAAAGFALSAATVRWMTQENKDTLEAVVPFDSKESNDLQYGGFAFGPKAYRLRSAFDEQLNQFIGTERHLALVSAFGFTEEDCPSQRSAGEVLR